MIRDDCHSTVRREAIGHRINFPVTLGSALFISNCKYINWEQSGKLH
jgi:hypothetical protein